MSDHVQVEVIPSLQEYKQFASHLVKRLASREVLLLSGPMGAGKTELVRHIVQALGGNESSSPTFAIHNRYETHQGSVDHLDLYRLEDEDDLESTGFWDLFTQTEGLIIIEWADRLNSEMLPPDWHQLHVHIDFVESEKDSGKRKVQTSG